MSTCCSIEAHFKFFISTILFMLISEFASPRSLSKTYHSTFFTVSLLSRAKFLLNRSVSTVYGYFLCCLLFSSALIVTEVGARHIKRAKNLRDFVVFIRRETLGMAFDIFLAVGCVDAIRSILYDERINPETLAAEFIIQLARTTARFVELSRCHGASSRDVPLDKELLHRRDGSHDD